MSLEALAQAGHAGCDCDACRMARLYQGELGKLVAAVFALYPERRADAAGRGVVAVAIEILHTAKGGGAA